MKKTYLFIFEDGAIKKSDSVTQDDLDSDYLQIVDISQQNDPVEYIDGVWTTIEEIK
jgi:hypothetical protein